jgi:glycerol-3-phosphate dehydrogenase (NAD(P)+)
MARNAASTVAVVGTTTWGTTLAIILARQGVDVRLFARTESEAERLRTAGEHTQRLPGHAFPPALSVTASLSEALSDVGVVLFAVPSHTLRDNARAAASHLSGAAVIISACKGLERDTMLRMSQVLIEELPSASAERVCCLSGPNLAREIVAGFPASTVIASANAEAATVAQKLLNSNSFRVYTNTDLVGVEMGGALKNIVALGAGMSDGLQAGNNAKAAFVSRGIAEITRLGVAEGADPLTFSGLAGLGDLIATCYSPLSRNRMVGEQLARGKSVVEAMASLGGEVAEGVTTTPAALALAERRAVEMPIVQLTHRVLFEGLDLREAISELMGRAPRPE